MEGSDKRKGQGVPTKIRGNGRKSERGRKGSTL
jgi:hypothetical protein